MATVNNVEFVPARAVLFRRHNLEASSLVDKEDPFVENTNYYLTHPLVTGIV